MQTELTFDAVRAEAQSLGYTLTATAAGFRLVRAGVVDRVLYSLVDVVACLRRMTEVQR